VLPDEDSWEAAAMLPGFHWGGVWEWTSSVFGPRRGFMAHPYRDYSLPWFGTHRVLKGAAESTPPRLRAAQYRNFYPAGRNDIFSGFRSCMRSAA
jgi:EgtB-related family protein